MGVVRSWWYRWRFPAEDRVLDRLGRRHRGQATGDDPLLDDLQAWAQALDRVPPRSRSRR